MEQTIEQLFAPQKHDCYHFALMRCNGCKRVYDAYFVVLKGDMAYGKLDCECDFGDSERISGFSDETLKLEVRKE